ncbi:MAG: hypothetical protein ACK4GQ_06145, partial [Candidatus Hadarchaeales archaeon]
MFAVIQEDTTSATDDLSEMHLTTGGGTWSALFDFWTGPTWANPQTEFAMIAHRRDNDFRLNVQHNITGIGPADNYRLEIEYYTAGDSEPSSLYLYNFSNLTWDNVGNLQTGGSASSPYLFTYNLTGTNYISGGEVRVRYVQPDNDQTQTSLMVDFCRVWAENRPTMPDPYRPENNSTVGVGETVTFEWENGRYATSHRIEIATSPDISPGSMVDNYQDNTDNVYQRSFSTAGTYYWRVVAINAYGENISENTWVVRICQWKVVESWGATITTSAAWSQVETWQATISTTAQWQLTEAWTATISTTAQWKLVETWTATITTSAAWQQAESWSATISTMAGWQQVEVW